MEIIGCEYQVRGFDSLSHIPHTHPSGLYEIMLVVEGQGHVLMHNRVLPLKKYGFYIINGMYSHCMRPERSHSYCRHKLHLEAAFFQRIVQLVSTQSFPLASAEKSGVMVELNMADGERMNALFTQLYQRYQKDSPVRLCACTACLIEMLAVALQAWQPQTSMPTIPSSARLLVDMVNRYAFTAYSLQAIADDCHLNKNYCCRLFRQTVGVTIQQYILEQRLARAKRLLCNGEDSISSIAQQCGFHNFAYFSHVFHKSQGCTPKEYRSRMQTAGSCDHSFDRSSDQ